MEQAHEGVLKGQFADVKAVKGEATALVTPLRPIVFARYNPDSRKVDGVREKRSRAAKEKDMGSSSMEETQEQANQRMLEDLRQVAAQKFGDDAASLSLFKRAEPILLKNELLSAQVLHKPELALAVTLVVPRLQWLVLVTEQA
ncbi:hypothetical protein JKP88DRAFT_283623 [Tribonema minus]|uniref:Uncharacterized protein n=1 Tax=Tribonema minus TaxID=303371 RepID=A0A835YRQ6_9STRA|nr:hypothetical protein JKP88DRAFT_283623 [Tribonema minus]